MTQKQKLMLGREGNYERQHVEGSKGMRALAVMSGEELKGIPTEGR